MSDGSVSVPAVVLERIVAHARTDAPAECCGILLGRGDRIVDAVRAANLAEMPMSRFVVDPKSHIDARRAARGQGLEVLGFYHSHPRSPAQPSDTDVAEAGYPDHLYLIVSLQREPPEAHLFRLTGGNFHEVCFVTVA